jgi:hypothetical protein
MIGRSLFESSRATPGWGILETFQVVASARDVMISGVPATQKEWIKRLQEEGWTENKRRAYSKGFEAQLRREAGLQDRQP